MSSAFQILALGSDAGDAALMAEQANRIPRAVSRMSTAEKENLP